LLNATLSAKPNSGLWQEEQLIEKSEESILSKKSFSPSFSGELISLEKLKEQKTTPSKM
jgi:hypothetical protein